MNQRPGEVTIRAGDEADLFRERAFDPFADDVDGVSGIAAMASLPHLASNAGKLRIRVLLPPDKVKPETEARVNAALGRYCEHMVRHARRRLAALRWVGLRTLAVGLAVFGLSLAASTAVGRLLWIPDELRTLASESLIVAGWVVLWQPLDTLVQGWWPHWDEERTFKALARMHLTVQPDDHVAAGHA
jgi:hypothetical protein